MNKVILLLGSNLGNKKNNLEQAFSFLQNEIGTIEKISPFLETEPEGYLSNNNYINVALALTTFLSPLQVLKKIKFIERKMGRLNDTSITKIYTDRIIDIDIVNYNNIIFENKSLSIPHFQHTHCRKFSIKLLNTLV